MDVLLVTAESDKELDQFVSFVESYGGHLTSRSELQGFSGTEWLLVLTIPLTKVIIPKLANIIITWLNTKGARSVKLNGLEIKGYSALEVEALLASARKVRSIETKNDNESN